MLTDKQCRNAKCPAGKKRVRRNEKLRGQTLLAVSHVLVSGGDSGALSHCRRDFPSLVIRSVFYLLEGTQHHFQHHRLFHAC